MKKLGFVQVSQLISNLAVVAGIVFLALELSQNTTAMRAQSVQAVQAEFREIFDLSPVLVAAAMKPPGQRTEEEVFVRRVFFSRVMRIFENQWYQYSQGYLDEALFNAYQQHLRITLGQDEFAQLWELRKGLGFFHPDFVRYVDTFIANNPPYSDEDIGFR